MTFKLRLFKSKFRIYKNENSFYFDNKSILMFIFKFNLKNFKYKK